MRPRCQLLLRAMGTPTTAGAGGALMDKWRGWVTPKRFWWGLLVVVLAVSSLFGGLRTASTKDRYTELAAGQTYNAGQFDVTVQNARIELLGYGTKLDIRSAGAGYVLLVVEATIKNTSAETAAPPKAQDASDPELVQAGIKPDKLFNAEYTRRLDYTPASALTIQPGMTDRIVFVWSATRSSLTIGQPIVVQINGFERAYTAGLSERWQWNPASRHGVYHLTLEDSA